MPSQSNLIIAVPFNPTLVSHRQLPDEPRKPRVTKLAKVIGIHQPSAFFCPCSAGPHSPSTFTMAGKFAPKEPVQLAPPKDDLISLEHLAKCNGKLPMPRRPSRSQWMAALSLSRGRPRSDNRPGTNGYPCYVAIKVISLNCSNTSHSLGDRSNTRQGIVFDVNNKEPYLPGGSYSSTSHSTPVPFLKTMHRSCLSHTPPAAEGWERDAALPCHAVWMCEAKTSRADE
jgi:hypothetical protein